MAKTGLAVKAKAAVKPKTQEAPAGDNFDRAKRCLESIGESWYTFDLAVAEIYESEAFTAKDYPKFGDCAKGEWGMSYSNAMNHVKVGQTIRKFQLTHETLKSFGISWTNFMEISGTLKPEMTKAQVESRLKKAGKMTHDQVVKFKQEITHGVEGGHPVKLATIIFKLKNEAADVVAEALKMAKELMGVEYDDAAIEYICVDWMQEHDPAKVKKIKKQLKSDLTDEAEEGEEEAAAGKPAKKQRKERADKGKKKAAVVEEEEEEIEDELDDDDDGDDDLDSTEEEYDEDEDDDVLGL